jgi:hypothetical protein
MSCAQQKLEGDTLDRFNYLGFIISEASTPGAPAELSVLKAEALNQKTSGERSRTYSEQMDLIEKNAAPRLKDLIHTVRDITAQLDETLTEIERLKRS